MEFKYFSKKDVYKYNDIEEVEKWEQKVMLERFEDINPEVIFEMLEKTNPQFGHPPY